MIAAGGTPRSSTRDAVGVALLVAIVLALPLVVGGPEAIRSTFQDDAFYYARIARNIARGSGITFDGLHFTSGFHPLWLGLLVPLFVVFSGPTLPLTAAVVLQILLVSGAAALTTATFGRIVDRWSAMAGGLALLAIPETGSSLIGGLEGALTLACAAAAWWLWLDVSLRTRAEPVAWIGPGIALACAGCARVEAFLLVPVAVAFGFRSMARPRASAAALCAPAAFAVLAIAATNFALTATWLPISAMVKSVTRMDSLQQRLLPSALGVAVAAGATGLSLMGLRRRPADAASSALLLPAVGASFWIAADLISVGRLEPWNRVPVLLLGAVGIAFLSSKGGGKVVAAVVAALAVARAPLGITRGTVSASSYAPYRWEAGLWLRDHLDADARIGSWNAGTIGYASDRHVVNLDGLVNDRAYFDEVLRGGAFATYLEREGISYFADQACGADPTLEPYLARTASTALLPRAVLVASFFDRTSPGGCPGVAIWHLRKD